MNSGQALYKHEPVFRETVDKCSRLLQDSLGKPLLDVLYPPVEQEMAAAAFTNRSALAQPAAFVFGYALAQMWLAWGLEPQAMAGQGVGEYVAACVAGVYSLEAALTLVAVRGQLTQNMPKQPHLEVALSESECRSLLGEAVALTAVISPTTCILVGAETEIEALATELTANDIVTRRLPALDAAYSPFIEPVLPEFSDRLDLYDRQAPQILFLSNVTGDWITDEEARDDKYWLNQLRQPLRLREKSGIPGPNHRLGGPGNGCR
ncbi:MAG: acyltransferase domain-containing protein [Chloroflexi bacterium]|nr:acyltransferase domain-containing protein [Chloroflexota bacterium]